MSTLRNKTDTLPDRFHEFPVNTPPQVRQERRRRPLETDQADWDPWLASKNGSPEIAGPLKVTALLILLLLAFFTGIVALLFLR
jgi:hypothetical protein